MEEDKNMQLVDEYEAITFEYVPPFPGHWQNWKSDIEIERLLVTDSRPKVCEILSVDVLLQLNGIWFKQTLMMNGNDLYIFFL